MSDKRETQRKVSVAMAEIGETFQAAGKKAVNAIRAFNDALEAGAKRDRRLRFDNRFARLWKWYYDWKDKKLV